MIEFLRCTGNHASAHELNHLFSLGRTIITGGASAAVEPIKAFRVAVPSANLIEPCGILETGFHSFTGLTDDPLKINGAVGRCVDSMPAHHR